MIARDTFERLRAGRIAVLSVLFCALVTLALCDLTTGASGLSVGEVLAALAAGHADTALSSLIVWSIRLPMLLTVITVGMALALAGLSIQTLTGNALASPATLGITSAASFGAALAITAEIAVGPVWLGSALLSLVFALLVSALIWLLGHRRGMRPSSLILAGIVMNFFFMALREYLQYRASPEVAQLIAGWTFGNLERSAWLSAAVAGAVLLLALLALLPKCWALTALTLGAERAQSLGVPVARLRIELFLLSAALVAASVAFIGTIGFVGLVAPHCAKLMLGSDQRYVMIGSVLMGAVMMLASTIAAKLLSSGAMLPVGIVTSLIGVPFLLVLLLRAEGAR